MNLRFARASPYHLKSACGRYTVDGARMNSSGKIRYGAWHVPGGGAMAQMLGCFDGVDAAKARCEQHAQGGTHESTHD